MPVEIVAREDGVVTETVSTSEKVRKPKVQKAAYTTEEKSVEWPIEGLTFSEFKAKYMRLKKKYFKTTKSLLLYMSDSFKNEAEYIKRKYDRIMAKAERFTAKANGLARFKTEEQAEKYGKLLRMKEQLAKIQAELGIDEIAE